MYFFAVILLMFVFPITSIIVEIFFFKSSVGIVPLIGKWFVFWAIGVRLFTAGLRQSFRPKFTAEKIFGITANEPLVIVQELGFANLSIGMLGIISIFINGWIMPSSIVGALFIGLAGIKHFMREKKNRLENIAMVSNLFIFIVMSLYIILTIVH